ncbi:MAG TPA: DALR anticodon-binding domain-containing protein, partial [Gammaproteobacteria bacterium]|nr:DALR anticodon-binding domain-containing protein [Gammaproteobacteria bacterium]
VMRKSDQHLDFDLELAKSRSNENPVFYVQYAHARICSVFRQGQERGFSWDEQQGRAHLHLLSEEHEQRLLMSLARYPEAVEQAAVAYEPHQLAYYLRELATDFHTYYNAHAFLVEDAALRNARLALLAVTRTVLSNGLKLLGVSAPESM